MTEKGQALTEAILVVLVATGLLTWAWCLLEREWTRSECVYQVFELTHSSLTHRVHPGFPKVFRKISVQIESSEKSVKGTGQCGGMSEAVELPHLEHARW